MKRLFHLNRKIGSEPSSTRGIENSESRPEDLPDSALDYIEKKRQEVLKELEGKYYADRFANAVAKNLTEKALISYSLYSKNHEPQ